MFYSQSSQYRSVNGESTMKTVEVKNNRVETKVFENNQLVSQDVETITDPIAYFSTSPKSSLIGVGALRRCSNEKKIGKIEIWDTPRNNTMTVKVAFKDKGLKDGLHGFHLHRCGDEVNKKKNCASMCDHYTRNRGSDVHGGLGSLLRHNGDLGNITSSKGKIKQVLNLTYEQLRPEECFGRSFIIHEGEDDIGKGGDAESLRTGNSGKRYAYGIIGRV